MTFICVSNWLSGLARFISDRAFLLEQPSSPCLLVTTIRRARSLVSWVAGGVLLENAVAKGLQEVVGGVLTNLCAAEHRHLDDRMLDGIVDGLSFCGGTRNSEAAKRDSRKGDDIKIWVGNEKKKATCVRFLFVQPGVVSTCNVTERIFFCQKFCCSFQEGRFGVLLDFF